MEDELSRYTHLLFLVTHWGNAGKWFHLDLFICRSEGEDQQVKMKCFRWVYCILLDRKDWIKQPCLQWDGFELSCSLHREPHRQIEKRRRDKMNSLIDELSAMIPSCQPMARKLDKLTVLRKAVQHLKALKGNRQPPHTHSFTPSVTSPPLRLKVFVIPAGTSGAFTDTSYKPSILPHDDLIHLLLRVGDDACPQVQCDSTLNSLLICMVLCLSPRQQTVSY